MVRGIERRRIFRNDHDRRLCLQRLATVVTASSAGLYAWCLMPNHVHVLLRTGGLPLSLLMRRWVGPYASAFNRRHHRSGHLFQNRFKSIVVEEEPYLLALVRYIHLNPVRAGLCTIDELDRAPWTGHAVLLGQRALPAQDADVVLTYFGRRVGQARAAYREFIRAGVDQPRPDLSGGGLRRSAGGWEHLPALRRGREGWAHDERILGGTEFVRGLVEQAQPLTTAPARADAIIPAILRVVAAHSGVTPLEIASSVISRRALSARAIVCQLAARRACPLRAIARALGISKQSVARAIARAGALETEVRELERQLIAVSQG